MKNDRVRGETLRKGIYIARLIKYIESQTNIKFGGSMAFFYAYIRLRRNSEMKTFLLFILNFIFIRCESDLENIPFM